ncbi:MAG: MBL fold metallo-hydrolase, partial [Candidatus Thermoplasmatota archaeon]|nr:MBL fold metallo-hydrolase [Candidatus Thermoplasmatota archaeon]
EVQGAKRGRNIVYKFEIDGLKFCHLGDLGEMPDDKLIASMKPIDILFTPVGNVFTIGAKQAKELAKKLEARVIIPMHYRVRGLSLSINGVDDFISLFPEEMVNRIGNEVDFLAEDLPSEQEVWVFNI